MPKIVSVVLGGILAALVTLEAQPHVTWRSALLGAIAFLGSIGVPAVHGIGAGSPSSSNAGVAPPFQDVPAVAEPPAPPATPPPAQQQVQ